MENKYFHIYLGTFTREHVKLFGTVINTIKMLSKHGRSSIFQELIVNDLFYKFIDSPLLMESLPPVMEDALVYRGVYVGSRFPYNMTPEIHSKDLLFILKKYGVPHRASIEYVSGNYCHTLYISHEFLANVFEWVTQNPNELEEVVKKHNLVYDLAQFKKAHATMVNIYNRAKSNEDFLDSLKEIFGEDCEKYFDRILDQDLPRQ